MKQAPANHRVLLMDYYALTMAQSHFSQGRQHEIAYFDYFFRTVPDHGGYAIFAGLTQVLDYLEFLHFTPDDIAFLRSKGIFTAEFLDYLANFRFHGDIRAVPEGSVVFPHEPAAHRARPLIDSPLIETYLLLTLNHQSRIATKAARIVHEAAGRPVFEFGSRRAHGGDAAHYGARAAYIGGVAATSNTYSEYVSGIPAVGTMAHAYVQSFDSEYEAFLQYAKTWPDNTVLLVDTYDTLRQGIPNAIRVHNEYLAPNGHTLRGIRIDSGDLAYLSNRAREMLDAVGLHDAKITVSNSLDEYLIKDLVQQGAAVDNFGVGERLITAKSNPVFGGVYKIVALEKDGAIVPKIKISETLAKTTTPGYKQLWRLMTQAAKPSPTSLPCTTKKSTTASPTNCSTPNTRGNAKPSAAFAPKNGCKRGWKRARAALPCRRSPTCAPTASANNKPCGTKSAAWKTRTATTSISRQRCGNSNKTSSANTPASRNNIDTPSPVGEGQQTRYNPKNLLYKTT